MSYALLNDTWVSDYEGYEIKYRAVIVEPRRHKALEKVLVNISEKLGCPITIVHGLGNKDYVLDISRRIPEVDMILELNAWNLNANMYSKLFIQEFFWDEIRKGEGKILIFQTDSGICGDGDEIHRYLEWDYCGAPWTKINSLWRRIGDSLNVDKRRVGNGGFSIRNPEMAKKHIRIHDRRWRENEDKFFSKLCSMDGDCQICDFGTAREFACEKIDNPDAWAFHNNWKVKGCALNMEISQLQGGPVEGDVPGTEWVPVLKRIL